MRLVSLLILLGAAGLACPAEPMPSLEQLFTRPYAWGTQPTKLRWSKTGHVLLFLWNAEGRRFRDLYAWRADTEKLVRLSDLESQKDELNVAADEKDERLRRYLMPPAGLSSFEMCDDGHLAVFAYKGDLYLADTSGGKTLRRLTRTKAVEGSPSLSPDGKLLASVRQNQLIVQKLETGELWQATDIPSGDLTDYLWSPDGSRLLYSVQKGKGRQLPLPNYSGRIVSSRQLDRSLAGDESPEVKLFHTGVNGGKAAAIDRGSDRANIASLEWSPDGKRILIVQIMPDYKKRQLLVADLSASKARLAAEEEDPRWVEEGFASWSPDSQDIFFTNERTGWAHLYKLSLAEGAKPAAITAGAWEIRNDTFSLPPQWVKDQWAKDWIYYSSTEVEPAQRQFYRIRPDGASKERLSSGEGLRVGAITDDGKYTALLQADERSPFDIWVNGKRVTTSPAEKFSRIPWPNVRYVNFPSRGDGKQVAAKVLLPVGYRLEDKAQKPRPAVVYVHGAGIATSVLKQWGSYNELRYVFNAWLVSRGYVVIDLDYRGSTGYGRDWRSDVYLHLGGKDLDDVLGGVDYLRSLGNIDMNRLGIWGVSYGGFMTDMALFQAPGVFRAGAAWAAVNDWENYNAGYTGQRLNSPASNPEAYRRSSPIWFSNNLRDKLLIVHGIVDDNVLFQDAVQLTEKLIHEGKDFSQIFYPEESHGFVRDETWSDALRRTAEWFERWLQPNPPGFAKSEQSGGAGPQTRAGRPRPALRWFSNFRRVGEGARLQPAPANAGASGSGVQ